MIKKLILPLLTLIALIYMSNGCNLKVTTTEWGPTKTITQTPTITPTFTPVVGVFVAQAAASLLNGYTTATSMSVVLYEDTGLGNTLTGATVTMGGYTLTESPPGTYSYLNSTTHLFASGDVINLNITSSRGSASSGVIMSKQVAMTAPANLGSIPVSSAYSIQWSYPDGVPAGMSTLAVVAGAVTYVNESLPGATTARLIPANTMASGGLGIATIVTKNTAVINGATPGSADFTCGWAGMNFFSPVP
jgi:hypothetical protein